MAEYVTTAGSQLVDVSQNVLLIDSDPCQRGWVLHRNGSGILTLRGVTCGCARYAKYHLTFSANIAVPTGGTVDPIAIALAIDGEPILSSRAVVTPAAVGDYQNATATASVIVPRGCCYTVSVKNAAAGVDESVAQQAISVADGNLTVDRTA